MIDKCFVCAEVDMGKLTRSLVSVCVMAVSRFSHVAVPIPSSAVRADAKFLVQWQLRSGVEGAVDKI